MTDTFRPTPPFLTPVGRAEELIPSLLSLLVLIGLGGIAAFPVSVWPFDFSDIVWRERSGALFLTTMPPLVFLLAIVLVAGVYAGQHHVVRAAGLAFFVLAALMTVVVPAFFLDFVALRVVQTQEALGPYTREGLRLCVIGICLIPSLIWAGRRAWYAGRPDPGAELTVGHGLVVGREP